MGGWLYLCRPAEKGVSGGVLLVVAGMASGARVVKVLPSAKKDLAERKKVVHLHSQSKNRRFCLGEISGKNSSSVQ